MKNKKNYKIIHTVKHLILNVVSRLFNSHDAVVYVRPTYRDIHLNSTLAISIWLVLVDRPIVSIHGDTQTDKSYAIAPHNQIDWQHRTIDGKRFKVLHSHIQTEGGGTTGEELE